MDTNREDLVKAILDLLVQGGADNIRTAIGLTQTLRTREIENAGGSLDYLAEYVRELLYDGSLRSIETALERLNEMLLLSSRQEEGGQWTAPVSSFSDELPPPDSLASEQTVPAEIRMGGVSVPKAEYETLALGHKVLTGDDILATSSETHPIQAVACSSRGNRFAVGTLDGRIRLSEVQGGTLGLLSEFQGSGSVTGLCFQHGRSDGIVGLYGNILNVVSYREKHPRVLARYESLNPISCATVSPNGKLIAFSNTVGMLGVLSYPEEHQEMLPKKLELVASSRLSGAADSLDFCWADVRRVAYGGANGSCGVMLLARSGEEDSLPELFHHKVADSITAVSYRRDAQYIALNSGQHSIALLRLEGPERNIVSETLQTYESKTPIVSLQHHPNREILAFGTEKGELKILCYGGESRDGALSLFGEYSAEEGPCKVAYNADGSLIALSAGTKLHVIRQY